MSSFETRLAAAMTDIAVPAGLHERLSARLRQSAAETGEPTAAIQAAAEPVTLPLEPIAHRHLRRRWLLATGALAASLLVAWQFLMPADDSRTDTATLAAGWYAHLGAKWQPLRLAPTGFSVPAAVAVPAQSWQAVHRIVGRPAVAFDLAGPGAKRAVLFVVKSSSPNLPGSPPATPSSTTTGGQTIAAWQNSGFVYVLVVEGDEREYRRLIHASDPRVA
jgi:hypothetical protein